MKGVFLLSISLLLTCSGFSQLILNNSGDKKTINFAGFNGSGFESAPAQGQLDSDTWSIKGMSDGDIAFGGSGSTGDFVRGSSTGGESIGGIYSFSVGTGTALGVQPSADDFTPGSFILQVENKTGNTLTSFDIAYDIYVLNNEYRSNSFNFSYSTDNSTYTAISALDFTSTAAADASPAWAATNKSTTIDGIAIATGDFLYLKWTGDDVAGSGSRDEFALDNIDVTGYTNTAVQFVANAASIAEGGSNSYNITVSIINPNPSFATTADIVLTGGTANSHDHSYTTTQVNFASGSSSNETVTVTITGDDDWEVDETMLFEIQNVSGGFNATAGTMNTFTLTITNDDVPNAWINELHYDNTGADVNEFIEVVVDNNYTGPLSDLVITLYNGSNTNSNGTHALNTFMLGDVGHDFTIYYKYISGLQNDMEGICLHYKIDGSTNEVIQFLSYEGSFTAGDGPAYNLSSKDILRSEDSTTPVDQSLYLTGSGSQYSDYSWTGPGPATPGYPNDGQVLPVEWLAFTGQVISPDLAVLEWTTATERDNDYFEIQHATDGYHFIPIGNMAAAGNSNTTQQYRFVHQELKEGVNYYRIRQVNLDGSSSLSNIIQLKCLESPVAIAIYPNPAYNKITFRTGTEVEMVCVMDLIGHNMGSFRINHNILDISHLAPGSYFLQVESENGIRMIPFIKL